MNSEVKISIIIPFYNAERYIETCVKSLKSQTYSNFEAIFIDDGSTDKTIELLHHFWDDRFVLLRQEKKGVSSARNLGLVNLRGDYIAFMDVDDELMPDYLLHLMQTAEFNNVPIVLCDYYDIYASGQKLAVKLPWANSVIHCDIIRQELIPRIILDDGIRAVVWRTFIKRDFWEATKIFFDERVIVAEDLLFLLSLYSRAEKIYILSEELYGYKRNNNSTLNSFKPKGLEKNLEFHRIFVKLLKAEGLYESNEMSYTVNKIQMYTSELSNLSRNPELFSSISDARCLREELIKEPFDWRDYPLSKGRRLSLWMLECKMYHLLLVLYRIKEVIRLKRYSK